MSYICRRLKPLGILLSSASVALAAAFLVPPASASENATYTYDALGRLVVVSKANAANTGSNANYQYDNAGNRSNVFVNSSWTLNTWYAPDINGDGRSDVLWRNDDGVVTSWLADTAGGFSETNQFAGAVVSSWKIVAVGDFNGDGRSDILWRYEAGAYSEWLGQSDGSFTYNAALAGAAVSTDWQAAGVGDFNGDGRADILWRNTDGTLTDWFGTADGTFYANWANFAVLIDPAWKVVGTADFNGDGRSDILLRKDTGELTVWLAQTNGSFVDASATYGATVTPDWKIIGTGDFDGDGRADILWRNNDGTLTDWSTNANGSYSGGPGYGVPTDWNVVATGDFNGDRKADLLWRNTNGDVFSWFGTSGGAFVATSFGSSPGIGWHVEPRRAPPTSPVPPPAYFAISDAPAINEGANAVFTIARVGTYETTQSVNYATASGTATSGSDFTATSGTLTFGPTDTQKTVAVPTIMDGIAEPAESLTMTISSPTAGATLGRATATGIINASSAPVQPPVANGDSLTVGICDSGTVNVIANDTDPAGNYPLTLVSVGTSNIGQAVVQDSTTVYFSAGGTPGGANITYTVKNSLGATATGIISVNVTNGTGCM